MYKIKHGYKVELQTPKTMKVFGSTKKFIDKTKNWENVPSLEVIEAVLVHCNLVDNQHLPKYEILYSLTLSKSYAYLSDVEPSNLVKTYDTEFNETIIKFTNQNGRPLEIEGKVNLILLIKKYKWQVIP